MTPGVYEQIALRELKEWQKEMLRSPGFFNRVSAKLQTRMNRMLPEKLHRVITITIKQMVRAVLFGAELVTSNTGNHSSLEIREAVVKERIKFYKHTAAAEGGITGAGGILLGLADFPLLLTLKLKLLFEIASIYGYAVQDYRERLYLLYIFQMAFSSQESRKAVYQAVSNWKEVSVQLPDDIHQFDWRMFQQQYRDYIDLAKIAQLLPVVGAPVGAVANYRLIRKLGRTAMNAYRLRMLQDNLLITR